MADLWAEGAQARAVVIAGPTAGGKSAAALAMAARRPSVIINADAMQVYSELAIITARPDRGDLARARHALYGHVPAQEAYSVARFLADVAGALGEAARSGHMPIVVGGTGLYLTALFEGLAPVPDIAPEIRAHWRTVAAETPEYLHEALAARDPALAARLEPGDTQRLTRALEVIEATGRSLLGWQSAAPAPLLSAETCLRLVLAPERAELYARIKARVDAMLAAGAVDEVAALVALGLSRDLPAMRAVGVPELAGYLAGECALDQARDQMAQATRRLAKRQGTWLRGKMVSWNWVSAQQMQRFLRV